MRRFSGLVAPRAWPRLRSFCTGGRASSPLLQPPRADDGGPIHLNFDCGLDLDARSVPTISIVGPSRRGKSVLAGLLAGGDPALFPQSHSSFIAMTSGTHVCEVSLGGQPVRVVDTEGLSHIGRSRKSESLVRQFLISTYLTSSWVVWLDTDVLSSNFFNMMWLVHDYVADVLRIRDSAGTQLPRLMYIRTQETELQSREWKGTYGDFGEFFAAALENHEDACILTQMFAKGGVMGRALPVWTEEDLDRFVAGEFWRDEHSSQFKSAVASVSDVLMAAADGGEDQSLGQPPLLALGELERHLPKIAKLEAFDPRDHEATKVIKARNYLRSAYGRLFGEAGGQPGEGASADPVGLANLFEPDDRDVRNHDYRLDKVVRARLERKCDEMRVEVETALADAEVRDVLAHFDDQVSVIFSAGVEAFVADGSFSEASILRSAIEDAGLDADKASALLAAKRESAEDQFLRATGLSHKQMRALRLHEQVVWRIDDCLMRLRRLGRARLQLEVPEGENEVIGPENVWRLGEWELKPTPKDGKTVRARRPKACALWTDGQAWALYEEHPSKDLGKFFGRGELKGEGPRLPVP